MIDKNKLLISKVDDIVMSVKKGRAVAFTQFLGFDDCEVIKNYLSNSNVSHFVFGGYDDSERKVIAVTEIYNDNDIDFPIACLCFSLPHACEIEHRDVLGALMSLGIKRELIGDILFSNDKCMLFVIKSISEYIINNLRTVKKITTKLELYNGCMDYKRCYKELFLTVSSMRIDCIVSELIQVSRKKSVELIESGLVFVNGIQALKKDKNIHAGDSISIRRAGKYRIESICGTSKKGKIKLDALKYN